MKQRDIWTCKRPRPGPCRLDIDILRPEQFPRPQATQHGDQDAHPSYDETDSQDSTKNMDGFVIEDVAHGFCGDGLSFMVWQGHQPARQLVDILVPVLGGYNWLCCDFVRLLRIWVHTKAVLGNTNDHHVI